MQSTSACWFNATENRAIVRTQACMKLDDADYHHDNKMSNSGQFPRAHYHIEGRDILWYGCMPCQKQGLLISCCILSTSN